MSVRKILSAQNEYIKKLSKLKTAKGRKEFGLFINEGERSCFEAVKCGFDLECVVMTEEFFDSHENLFSDFEIVVTSEKAFTGLCDTKTPQGVLAVAKIPKTNKISKGKYMYLDSVRDPGNAGTIIRSAHAFGFSGVIFSKECVDVFSPKVIRSSMGSVFYIDVLTDADIKTLEDARNNGFFITASALYGESKDVSQMTKKENMILVAGNEAEGVSEEILSFADEIVHINMPGGAESLNVAVASSVLMYEVVKDE